MSILRRWIALAGTLAAALLLPAPGAAEAQTADDYVGAAAAMTLAEQHLDAPVGSYDYPADAISLSVEGFEYVSVRVRDRSPVVCRVSAAAAFWAIAYNFDRGDWTVDITCDGGYSIDARADLDASPSTFYVTQYRNGSRVFRTSWSGNR